MTQELVLEAVKNMPVEFEIKDLIERLDFMEKVSLGMRQIEQGKTVPHSELPKIVQTWQK